MGAHDGGMYSIRLSGKIESRLHASSGEFGRDARDTRETRNGDYRTVRSTVVRMPSLPPECLLVAAHASSLPPPMAEPRRAASDASGRPETPERARTRRPPLVPPRPSPVLASPTWPRGAFPSPSRPPATPLSASGSRPCSRQFALGATRCAWRCSTRNGARTGGSLITPWRITAYHTVSHIGGSRRRLQTTCPRHFEPVARHVNPAPNVPAVHAVFMYE